MEGKFKIGDVVVLKAGGPSMTIVAQKKKHLDMTSPATFTGQFVCVWHVDGIENRATYHQDALKLE